MTSVIRVKLPFVSYMPHKSSINLNTLDNMLKACYTNTKPLVKGNTMGQIELNKKLERPDETFSRLMQTHPNLVLGETEFDYEDYIVKVHLNDQKPFEANLGRSGELTESDIADIANKCKEWFRVDDNTTSHSQCKLELVK